MNQDCIRHILNDVSNGKMSVDDALFKIRVQPFKDIGFAKIDSHRGVRQGTSEIIFGIGKTPEQIISISESMIKQGESQVIITRIDKSTADIINHKLKLKYYPTSRIGIIGNIPDNKLGKITIITAGTSDIPVAEEAAITAELLGNRVTRIYDVGVSGIHRLIPYLDDIVTSHVIIAIAGMDGALASVVGGVADCPVIAVPTSVGYGASFGGISALLQMLNSCATGVSVVNIDNGFGAGYIASMINHINQ